MESVDCLATIRDLFSKNREYFSALGNEERQQLILIILEGHNLSVGELASRTNLSRPTVSHHLKILRNVGIVRPEKHGNKTIYHATTGRYLDSIETLIHTIKQLT